MIFTLYRFLLNKAFIGINILKLWIICLHGITERNGQVNPNREFIVEGEDLILNDFYGVQPIKAFKSILNKKDDNVIEDFEHIPLSLNYGYNNDESSMYVIPNPDQSNINQSNWVVKYLRDKDGISNGGFTTDSLIQLTLGNFIHVKVWKPRISQIKFLIDDGYGSPIEKYSINEQSDINQWQDMVFDFSDYSGNFYYGFIPDYEDPLTLSEDIVIYFDDIIINNDPNPIISIKEITQKEVIFISPNPTNDKLTIQSDQDIQTIFITSISGQLMINFKPDSKNSSIIDVSTLSSGLYFIEFFNTKGSIETLKFIKY